jgi:hypothetical protein
MLVSFAFDRALLFFWTSHLRRKRETSRSSVLSSASTKSGSLVVVCMLYENPIISSIVPFSPFTNPLQAMDVTFVMLGFKTGEIDGNSDIKDKVVGDDSDGLAEGK